MKQTQHPSVSPFALKVLNVGLMAIFASGFASAQQAAGDAATATPTTLEEVVVKGKSSVQAAAQVQRDIPGGASLRTGEDVERRRALTIEDTLNGQPGVFAQSTGGTDAIKISIRGSGIASGSGVFRQGTNFYFDGLAVTAPGGTPYELFEPLGLEYTEVLRGANAFNLGASSIGGAVNFVTNTGKTAPGFAIRQEVGSYNASKTQLQYGRDNGDSDFYISYTKGQRSGFQEHSSSKTEGVALNYGLKVNADVDTRFFFRHRSEWHENPTTLTLDELTRDPRANSVVGPNNARQNSVSDKLGGGANWFGNKTNIKLDPNSQLELGAVYHQYQQALLSYYIPPANAAAGPYPSIWDWTDLNLSARYTRLGELWSLPSTTTVGFFSTRHLQANEHTYQALPVGSVGVDTTVKLKDTDYSGSADNVLNIGNELKLSPQLTAITGLTFSQIVRKASLPYLNTASTFATTSPGPGIRSVYGLEQQTVENFFSPRVGFTFEANPELQVYGNYSQSVDPITVWSYSSSGNAYVRPYKTQQAQTAELGLRFNGAHHSGSVTVYRSNVQDEILSNTVVIGGQNVSSSFNGSPTVHQGIEAALDSVLWKAPQNAAEKLTLRQTYTRNDFAYVADRVYGSNKLPGIPGHYYRGELEYSFASGYYAGVNLQAASDYFIDYANTFQAPGYGLIGLSAGYVEPGKKWRVFLDVKNLANRAYATMANTVTTASANPSATQASFAPGDGLSAYLGFSYKFD